MVREEVVLEQVKAVFESIPISENLVEAIRGHLGQAIGRLQGEYNQIQSRLSVLLDLRLAQSIIQDEYGKKARELKQRQHDLNHQLGFHTQAYEAFQITVSSLLGLASRAYELFESSKVDQKRQLMNFVLSNLVLRGKKLGD